MFEPDTEVLIIGNGPAGISLSAFLSGWLPYYAPQRPHPNPFVHDHLVQHAGVPLIDQDLSWYRADYEQRANPSVGLYSDLVDHLMRPEHPDKPGCYLPSCLDYVHHPERTVPHIVLGDSSIGGSWNRYDDNMATVSLCAWMSLPGYSLADFLGGEAALARPAAGLVRAYFQAYARRLGLQRRFACGTTVRNVAKLCHHCAEAAAATTRDFWRVRGVHADGRAFQLTARRLVLACGRSQHRRLEVAGERDAAHLLYAARDLGPALRRPPDARAAVLVVGDGISAADALIHCMRAAVPVVHVFRRTEKQLRGTMLSRLSSTVYPEYSAIFDLMVGRADHPLYTKLADSAVHQILPDACAQIRRRTKELVTIHYRCMVICVGLRSELNMLEDKYSFKADYQAAEDASLFAIGSVAGDHFVRYLVGGAFQVAQAVAGRRATDAGPRSPPRALARWLRPCAAAATPVSPL